MRQAHHTPEQNGGLDTTPIKDRCSNTHRPSAKPYHHHRTHCAHRAHRAPPLTRARNTHTTPKPHTLPRTSNARPLLRPPHTNLGIGLTALLPVNHVQPQRQVDEARVIAAQVPIHVGSIKHTHSRAYAQAIYRRPGTHAATLTCTPAYR